MPYLKQAQLQCACGPLGQGQCIAIFAGCLPNPYSSLLSYLLLFTSAVLASQRFQNVLFSPVGRRLGSTFIYSRTTSTAHKKVCHEKLFLTVLYNLYKYNIYMISLFLLCPEQYYYYHNTYISSL